MIEYIPQIRYSPNVINVPSAWGDIPTILHDLIQRFNLRTDLALDFGVERGYSTSALACYFNRVIGVDTFRSEFEFNDPGRESNYYQVLKELWEWPNIYLVQSMYQDFIKQPLFDRYDLIHLDMIHHFDETYDCGRWSVDHSDCVIFHDTVSFPDEVFKACEKLAEEFNLEFYNYPDSNGLGILLKK
jgi:hypothetical protein